MAGLTLTLGVGLGTSVLALHVGSVLLARALRTYSRSLLEEICAERGHPERFDAIAHHDESTERAAEALALLTALVLAAGLAVLAVLLASRSLQVETEVLVAILVATAVLHLGAGALGRAHAEAILDRLWPLTSILRGLTAPLTSAERALENLAYRSARRPDSGPRPTSVEVEIHSTGDDDEEDIQADLPEETRSILENVVELTRRNVSEVMIPRSSILSLPASTSLLAAARTFLESGHSRIPLFGENRDDIVGILYAKDLLARLVEPSGPDLPLNKLARPALFVPETKGASELMEEFRAQRVQMAVVLDEYGGVVGLITLEDLLEQIVGRIEDEHDDPAPDDPVVPLGGSRFEIDATLPIEQLNERLDLHLPTDEDFFTVGGLAFHALARLPEPGDSFRFAGFEFTILEVSDHSIRRVRLDLHPDPITSNSPSRA